MMLDTEMHLDIQIPDNSAICIYIYNIYIDIIDIYVKMVYGSYGKGWLGAIAKVFNRKGPKESSCFNLTIFGTLKTPSYYIFLSTLHPEKKTWKIGTDLHFLGISFYNKTAVFLYIVACQPGLPLVNGTMQKMGWKITQADLAERFGAPFRFGTAGLLREFLGSLESESPAVTVWFFKDATLQGMNISYLGKRKIIFKSAFLWDMLVPRRIYIIHYIIHCCFRQDTYQSKSWRYVSGLMQVPGSFFPGFAVARSLFDAALQITGACGLHHSRPGPSRGRCTKTRWDEVEPIPSMYGIFTYIWFYGKCR